MCGCQMANKMFSLSSFLRGPTKWVQLYSVLKCKLNQVNQLSVEVVYFNFKLGEVNLPTDSWAIILRVGV